MFDLHLGVSWFESQLGTGIVERFVVVFLNHSLKMMEPQNWAVSSIFCFIFHSHSAISH